MKNPIHEALDQKSFGAWGRIFGLSRQSISQWRTHSSIPRPYMRTFAELTGVTVEQQLEFAEKQAKLKLDRFLAEARQRYAEES